MGVSYHIEYAFFDSRPELTKSALTRVVRHYLQQVKQRTPFVEIHNDLNQCSACYMDNITELITSYIGHSFVFYRGPYLHQTTCSKSKYKKYRVGTKGHII